MTHVMRQPSNGYSYPLRGLLDDRGVGEGGWTLLDPFEAAAEDRGASPPTRLLDVSMWIAVCAHRILGMDLYKEFRDGSWHVGKVVSLSTSCSISAGGVRSRFFYVTVFDDGSTQTADADRIAYHNWLFHASPGINPIRVIIGDTASCQMERVLRKDFERVFSVNPAGTVVHYRDLEAYSPVSMSVVRIRFDGSLMVGLCIGRVAEQEVDEEFGRLVWVFRYAVAFDDGVVRLLTLSEMVEAADLFNDIGGRPHVRAIKVIF